MIEAKPGRYIAFVACIFGKEKRDWLAYAYRDPGGPWCAAYRFRYYAEGEGSPWDERDKKSGYDLKTQDGSDETGRRLEASLRAIAEAMVARGFNDRLDWLEVRSDDPDRFVALIADRPWTHVKMVPAETN